MREEGGGGPGQVGEVERGRVGGEVRGGEVISEDHCVPLCSIVSQVLHLFVWEQRPRRSRLSLPCTRARPCM